MNKYYYSALSALAALPFCAVQAFAEDPVITAATPQVDQIVSSSGMQATLLTQIQPWLVAGIGVAISVAVVFIGWRWISKFIKRGG